MLDSWIVLDKTRKEDSKRVQKFASFLAPTSSNARIRRTMPIESR